MSNIHNISFTETKVKSSLHVLIIVYLFFFSFYNCMLYLINQTANVGLWSLKEISQILPVHLK